MINIIFLYGWIQWMSWPCSISHHHEYDDDKVYGNWVYWKKQLPKCNEIMQNSWVCRWGYRWQILDELLYMQVVLMITQEKWGGWLGVNTQYACESDDFELHVNFDFFYIWIVRCYFFFF